MARSNRKRQKHVGLSPGALVYSEEQSLKKIKISLIDYDIEQITEREMKSVDECFPYRDKPSVSWIDIEGHGNLEALQKIGEHYRVHALVLEDILHTDQRPKFEDHGPYLFIVMRMLRLVPERDDVEVEQISLIVGENFVISFQEGKDGDVLTPVRERIRTGKGRIRKMGPDYLAYAIMDCVVDNYFVVLDRLEQRFSAADEQLLQAGGDTFLNQLHGLKRDILFMRKAVWPLREVISALQKSESQLIEESTEIFLRDLHDHVIDAADTIETFRDIASGLADLYLSSATHRTNQVIQFLTIMASIFIPLTFVAGVYGMNFEHMPELHSPYGYPAVLSFMALLATCLIAFFRRKGWI